MASINWKSELAKLEREFDGLPPRPSPAEIRQQRLERERVSEAAVPAAAPAASPIAVWARLALVAALAGALGFWPYARDCGPGLYAFIGAAAMIAVGGLWAGVCTWRSRTGIAHSLALMLVLVGLGAVGHQVLPRIGYAKTDPANPPQWQCAAAPDARLFR